MVETTAMLNSDVGAVGRALKTVLRRDDLQVAKRPLAGRQVRPVRVYAMPPCAPTVCVHEAISSKGSDVLQKPRKCHGANARAQGESRGAGVNDV